MATAPSTDDDLFDEFLSTTGHDTGPTEWEESYNKKQCPDCGGVHDTAAAECSVCGWRPAGR
ncbi:HVO_0416 family zinc finger protein [Halobaculum sp. MBLA0147]|uniref:HVO_0416 family zinc finger protein n=1 Tax=Halobaculum sp. MBLA0147 TaxID=3079934 RepID=UPI0035231AEB